MPELLPAIAMRRAGRAFSPEPVPPAYEDLLWEAAALAPSHGNTQPTRVLIARSPGVRERLVAGLNEGNRHWASNAPLLFALAADPSHDIEIAAADGRRRELYPLHVGIALGNLMAQATALGLTAHPMAAFDEAAVRAAFSAPESVRILVVVACGFPGDPATLPPDLAAREQAPQWRLPRAHRVAEDRWTPDLSVSARELRKRQS
ncbi:nitroreductase family protein [Tepidiforma sp.]|uniref:nitroreductase family protein n=1 Tax=Tepidiforma sp. TaxID=2682230 RepID=UPI002ADE93D7|nr:nitroreductase family protein [Tepidiforma sp.]